MPAEEFYALARDFEESGAKVGTAVYGAYKGTGEAFRDQWKGNAQETSGVHGKWYPASITTETVVVVGAVQVETGPDTAFKQGAMGRGFEFGSENQPPHLDGLRAMPMAERTLDRLSDAAIGYALP